MCARNAVTGRSRLVLVEDGDLVELHFADRRVDDMGDADHILSVRERLYSSRVDDSTGPGPSRYLHYLSQTLAITPGRRCFATLGITAEASDKSPHAKALIAKLCQSSDPRN